MLSGRKYKLLLIISVVFALLMVSFADASRSGSSGRSGGHTRGSPSSSRGFSGGHRSSGDSRHSSGRRDSSYSSRSSDSRSRFNSSSYNRGNYNYRSSRSRSNYTHEGNYSYSRKDNRKGYDRNRYYSRPFSGNSSSHTWQFSGDYTRYPHPYSNYKWDRKDYSYRRYSNPYSRYDSRYGYRYRRPYNRYYGYDRFGDNNRYYGYNRYGYDRYNPYYYPRYKYQRYFPYSGLGFGYWPYLYGGYSSLYYGGYSGYGNYGTYYYDSSPYVKDYSESSPGYRYSHIPRRYIFVSLNGYWPGYNYLRYYNFGTYPYFWYMSADSPYETPGKSSYVNDNQNPSEGPQNYEPFANITEPAKQTSTDQYFQRGVDLFAAGNYSRASDYFDQAKRNAPTDVILPFAYIQSLFAEGKYLEAARQLRDVMDRQPADGEWVFYPRGLYLDEKVLFAQVDKLIGQADTNSDLQLLAGYQLMGVGRYEDALEFLNKAQQADKNNQTAVGKLMFILNDLKANYQIHNAEK